MRKIIFAIAALLTLAIPASSSAADTARWISYPTCTATTTALTCTGRAAGLKINDPTLPPRAELWLLVRYTCSEDAQVIGFSWFGQYVTADWARNGQAFTLVYAPPAIPSSFAQDAEFHILDPAVACPSGNWIRDPSYYGVGIVVAQGFWFNFVLGASIGTVSPQ